MRDGLTLSSRTLDAQPELLYKFEINNTIGME